MATGPDETCGCEEGCRWHYESTAACTGRVWEGPWDDGTSRDSLSNRIFVDASGESMANDEAPVPPPAFETAEIVLHATMVADSEPPECGSDEYASHGSRTWTGEAFVGGDPHGFVTVLEWYWGGDRWSVALDGQPAVVWDLQFSTR